MATKRFGTQLKELVSTLDKNERLTPAEFAQRFKDIRNGMLTPRNGELVDALKNVAFIKRINKAYHRSVSGRVVVYFRKGAPMTMTFERLNTLNSTVKKAQDGVRKYWNSRKKTSK